jgi:exodeoxyribonuclease VII large subunit
MKTVSDGANLILARETLTVSALNRAVAGLLSRSFPLMRVRGEIANLTRAASGHWYFTLKDDSAQVRCAMFRGRNVLANFAPRDGDAVELLAQVNLYEARGEFQLNVESIQRAGAGRLYEEFLRLKARLAAEGLFDDARKRPLPAFPRAVGIVTSLQAAALCDVLTTLRRRAPYLDVIVYPVPVQGEGAGSRIAAMLDRASLRAEVEVIALVRGGGSIEDLWAFNEEVVARAIRGSRIPVVVGVGHESDFTIADFAADLRAATPTAAAELVAPDRAALIEAIARRVRSLQTAVARELGATQQRFDYALRALAAPRAPLRGLEGRVTSLRARLGAVANTRSARARASLARCVQGVIRARPPLAERLATLERLQTTMANDLGRAHQARAMRIARAAQALAHLDPRAVLERGYAIARDAAGRVVRDGSATSVGAALELTFARGGAKARVESTRSG